MCLLLSKCKGRCPSFTFKKMMDGFFEPEEMKDRKAVEFASKDKIMKAIKSKMLYMLVFIQKKCFVFSEKIKFCFSNEHQNLLSRTLNHTRIWPNFRTYMWCRMVLPTCMLVSYHHAVNSLGTFISFSTLFTDLESDR